MLNNIVVIAELIFKAVYALPVLSGIGTRIGIAVRACIRTYVALKGYKGGVISGRGYRYYLLHAVVLFKFFN